MKLHIIGLLLLISGLIIGCEDDIYPDLESAEPKLVVDAWIDNRVSPQVVRVRRTLPYYDANFTPGVSNATVYIEDNIGRQFNFLEGTTPGDYIWFPDSNALVIGAVGMIFQLNVEVDGEEYFAQSTMGRVPDIDSIAFRFEADDGFIQNSYFAELYARDFEGPGDTYWIQTWKNGTFLRKPNEMNLVFDAGFSAGGNIDGVTFIRPVRDGINPFEIDDNDRLVPPYLPGDQVYVEMHSISNEAFYFLTELRIQMDRPGGFAELFAVPLSNVPTNIHNINPTGESALGWFNVSAVSRGINVLDPNNLPN